MASTLKVPLSITYIGTATAILEIDGINILTDPFFSPAGSEWDRGVLILKNTDNPALALHHLPVIDAVLLSHEDHPDNLDEVGRRLLDGRRVITTPDGASKLAPRPGVLAIRPWETVDLVIGARRFQITGTPCQHVPGGEVTGFIIAAPEFGDTDGLPNAIYFSGDTVYLEELERISDRFHVSVALLNIGAAKVAIGDQELLITMDGKQAADLFKVLKADVLIPMHYESWGHFTENGEQLARVFKEEGIFDSVVWPEPGIKTKLFTRPLFEELL